MCDVQGEDKGATMAHILALWLEAHASSISIIEASLAESGSTR